MEINHKKIIEKKIGSDYSVYKTKNLTIITDNYNSKRIDRIYPIFEDESAYFAHQNQTKKGDIVLDLCTGSGIQALASAAKGAKKVYCSDINPRAKKFVELNAKINGFSKVIKFVESDLFEKLPGKKFDYITINPPFMPVPNNKAWHLHGKAGKFGDKFIKRILKEFGKYLKPKGKLHIIAHSLGNNRSVEIINLLYPKLINDYSIRIEPIFDKASIPIKEYTGRYAGAKNYKQWTHELKISGFTRFYYLTILLEKRAKKIFGWKKRMKRYHSIENLIQTKGGKEWIKE